MPKSEPQVEPFQEIRYRGQLARFRLPAHWTVEIDPDDGGCFYDPDSPGTLRLNAGCRQSRLGEAEQVQRSVAVAGVVAVGGGDVGEAGQA
jgi:hypothetical protein